jgi:hypothetical protein
MQGCPATSGYRSHRWVASAQLSAQFPDRKIVNGAASSVQEDMFEIQIEHCIRDGEINAERVVMCVSQAKLPNHDRVQKRCLDLVDVDRETLLPRSPINPPANAMRNGKWRQPDPQQRGEQEKKTNEKKSIL